MYGVLIVSKYNVMSSLLGNHSLIQFNEGGHPCCSVLCKISMMC